MTSVRHVIFDLDGTLVDSLPGIAWSVDEALRSRGLSRAPYRSRSFTGDLRSLIGPPVRDILTAVSGINAPEALDRLEESFRSSYDSAGWRRTICCAGVPEMLLQLRNSGMDLRMVTNKPSLATGNILRELKLAGFFQQIVCRDSRTPPFASKAEMLNDLLNRQGMQRAECLMVGDTAEDGRSAQAAGIACAIVPHGYGDLPPGGFRRIAGWHQLHEICLNAQLPAVD